MNDLEIKGIIDSACLRAGDVWFVVSARWYVSWSTFISSSTAGDPVCSQPGPIDNKDILKESSTTGELMDALEESTDYVLIPKDAWQRLVAKYGIKENQKPVERKVIHVISSITNKGVLQVEVYLLVLFVHLQADPTIMKRVTLSQTSTYGDLENIVAKLFGLECEFRMFVRLEGNKLSLVCAVDKGIQLHELSLVPQQHLVVDVPDNGEWHISTDSGTRQSANDWGGPSSSRLLPNSSKGLCGLNNLGNTCFMNSALQCLSNVPPLTKYFLSGKYKDEINNVNPLGMGGELAIAYAEVIRNIWTGKAVSFVPTKFKCTVGRFQPMFSGFQQQDAQELMAFLLDGLHEDLNRIRRKPYVEAKELENECDEVLAENAWRYYKMRNDSIITDLFNGLLKSTVICPECHKVSITFDPFGVLSLPLPEKPDKQILVSFVPLDPNQPVVQHVIGVKRNHVVKDVLVSLSSLVNVPAKRIICADLANGQAQVIQAHEALFRFLTARDRVDNKLIAYEVQEFTANEPQLTVCVYQVHQKWNGSVYNSTGSLATNPHLFRVPKTCDFLGALQRAVQQAFLRYVDPKFRSRYLQCWEEGKNGNNGDLDEGFNDDEHGDDGPFVLVQSSYTGDLLDADPAVPASYETVIYVAAKWNPSFVQYLSNERPVMETMVDETGKRSLRSTKTIELADCLDLFTLTEKLGEQDAWYCPRCKKHQQATKKFDLWSLPEVLVVHLKRFSSCRNYRSKIETLISFPIRNLVMSKWVINPKSASFTYNLVSVCNHDGSLGGGHYTASAYNCVQKKWYLFNDSFVRTTTESEIVTNTAYVLVYVRQGTSTPTSLSYGNMSMEIDN
uniref:Ubiquitin carboxyl-terminal hydrolase n=1 Tax=Trichuris muris TaxID=70415 RepID=A0A5S6QVM2_TRIMR